MADLALKVPLVPEADQALLRLGAALLLIVFAIKGALVPLHLWLPGTYGAASPPVAALFAIMTKVGVYAILRIYLLIFGGGAGAAAWIAAPYVLPAAAVTLAVGMIGVLASRNLTALAAYALVGSVGTLLVAVGLFTETGTAAALYYMAHSTLAAGALFLLADLVARRRGGAGDRLVAAPPFAQLDLLAGLFFLAAIASVGLPPLSGFIGKLLILQTLLDEPAWPWLWAVVLLGSLLADGGLRPRRQQRVLEMYERARHARAGPPAARHRRLVRHHGAGGSPDPAGPVRRPRHAGHGRHRPAAVQARPLHRGRARQPHPAGRPLMARSMRAPLPHPLLTLTLAVVWLALANEVSVGAVVLALVLGVIIPLATRAFWPDRPRVGRPLKMLEYAWVVLHDIVVANLQVARLILFVPSDRLRSRYVTIPLGADLARGHHRAGRHHHHDPGHAQRRALGRRRCAAGPWARRARPGGAGGRDQDP